MRATKMRSGGLAALLAAGLWLAPAQVPARATDGAVMIDQVVTLEQGPFGMQFTIRGTPCHWGGMSGPSAHGNDFRVSCVDPTGGFRLTMELDEFGNFLDEGSFLMDSCSCAISTFDPALGVGRYEKHGDPFRLELSGVWLGPGALPSPPEDGP